MKKCERCGMTYTDDHNFCTGCGSSLTAMPTASQTQTGNNTHIPLQNTDWFKSWGWLMFLILGLMCEWSISALLGIVLAALGFIGAMSSNNSVKKGVAIVLGIVAVIFLIIAFI